MPPQHDIASDDAIAAIRFPIRLLTLVCLLTIMAFVWFGWIIFDARRNAKILADRVSRIEEVRGVTVHLAEVLTMSVRMAAATGDSRWEEQYRRFEPQLAVAIKEVTKTGAGSPDIKAVTRTDAANIRLVEMENRAFALVRGGHKEEAQALLFSSEYEAQRQNYAEGIRSFTTQARHEFVESLRHDQRIDLLSIIAAVVVGVASFVAWLSAGRGVRRWRAQLLDSFRGRAEAEENLRRAHAGLEGRVKERTADLAKANETLQTEISERKRAEETLRGSEEKFRQLAENITDVFWMTSPDLQQMHYVSPAYERIWGRPAASLYAHPQEWVETILPEDRERTSTALGKLSGDESTVSVEYRIARPNGEIRWILSRGFQVRDAAGDVIRITGVASDITERKRAETQRERLADIVEASPDFIGFADPKTAQIQYINKQGRIMCGIGEDEDVGLLKISDVHPAWMNKLFAELIFPAAVRDGLWKGEGAFLNRDGREIPVLMDVLARKAANGEADTFCTISRDISSRKQAEDLVRASEKRYRALFESNPSPMWVYDLETFSFLAVNAAAVRLYGYSPDEFLTMTIKDIRPTEDLTAQLDDLAQSNDDPNHSNQSRHCTKDKTVIDVESTSHELTWLGRRAKVVLMNDITDRKKAEQKLLEQANLLNLAEDAIMVRGMDDRIEFWNRGAELLYGWSAEEVCGKPSGDFLDYEKGLKILVDRALLETGAWSGECHHLTKKGDTVIVRSRWTLVRDEHGQPKAKLIIATDVTEQRKLETHLLRAQRLESIGTLASGVAHDLNNILTPIMMCAETLRGDMSAEDREATLALIEDSAERGASVVKQVLTFARGVEGARVSINPSHLVHEMVDIAQKTFPKSIEITSRCPADLWSIKGDPTQLHQILLNISVNARDAMPTGGKLTLASENFVVDARYAAMTPGATPGSYMLLQISDTGSGMSRETIDKIFDPFFTTKELGQGTGLGLSTSLGIVKSHSGFISVHSAVGKGTIFKIFLPADLSGQSPLSSKPHIAPAEGNGELVLVVDDEPNVLRATKTILEKHNYRVVSASDGAEAVELFARQMRAVKVVVTDISMPHMDGVSAVRALRKIKPDVSIIASTGEAQQARLDELRALNVTKFLIKPFSTANLLAAVHESIDAGNGVEAEVQATT